MPLLTCVSSVVLSDMKLFVVGVEFQQVSQFLLVQLHIGDPYSVLHLPITFPCRPLLPQQLEHILGQAADNTPVLIWRRGQDIDKSQREEIRLEVWK